MDKSRIISKSKYVSGLQCLKYLWYLVNMPEAIPEFDEATQFRFQQGHEVGHLAKSLFPDGIEIEHVHGGDIEAELAMSREMAGLGDGAGSLSDLSGKRRPLFEAAFRYRNTFARADILEPCGTDKWNIIEVKSASSTKDVNKHDIAFQKYCYEGAGLKINKCYLMHLNRDYVKNGPIDARRFFVMDDVTAEAEMLKEDIEKNIDLMEEVINSGLCPEINIGKNCFNPYDCPLRQVCWESIPKNNVFELYKGRDLACYLYRKGIIEISEINETSVLSTIQLMQYKTITQNCEFTDRGKIGDFLKKLKYPLYFLDFETFATAIPLFDGLKPYQHIPFQFSCHFLQSLDASPQSSYFLAGNDRTDPRKGFLESLKKALGYGESQNDDVIQRPAGSILVYYESFEKNILRELVKILPEHEWWIEDAIGRIVDLYEPFGKFYYYNSRQKGSASLKNVLPSLTDKSYDDLEIRNGQIASIQYLNITFLKNEEEPDKAHVEKIRKDLLDYCGLDTEGMIFILRELYKIAE